MPAIRGGEWDGKPAVEPISVTIWRARLALGLSRDRLAQRLAEVAEDRCPTRELVARWERGQHIPGPYWRGALSTVLDVPEIVLERAATVGRPQAMPQVTGRGQVARRDAVRAGSGDGPR